MNTQERITGLEATIAELRSENAFLKKQGNEYFTAERQANNAVPTFEPAARPPSWFTDAHWKAIRAMEVPDSRPASVEELADKATREVGWNCPWSISEEQSAKWRVVISGAIDAARAEYFSEVQRLKAEIETLKLWGS